MVNFNNKTTINKTQDISLIEKFSLAPRFGPGSPALRTGSVGGTPGSNPGLSKNFSLNLTTDLRIHQTVSLKTNFLPKFRVFEIAILIKQLEQ